MTREQIIEVMARGIHWSEAREQGTCSMCNDQASAALTALEQAGYVVVPKVETICEEWAEHRRKRIASGERFRSASPTNGKGD